MKKKRTNPFSLNLTQLTSGVTNNAFFSEEDYTCSSSMSSAPSTTLTFTWHFSIHTMEKGWSLLVSIHTWHFRIQRIFVLTFTWHNIDFFVLTRPLSELTGEGGKNDQHKNTSVDIQSPYESRDGASLLLVGIQALVRGKKEIILKPPQIDSNHRFNIFFLTCSLLLLKFLCFIYFTIKLLIKADPSVPV